MFETLMHAFVKQKRFYAILKSNVKTKEVLSVNYLYTHVYLFINNKMLTKISFK